MPPKRSSSKKGSAKPKAKKSSDKGPCLKFEGLGPEQIKAVKQLASEFRRDKVTIDGYKAGHRRAVSVSNKGSKKSKGSGKPRATSGFMMFSNAERPKLKNSGLSFTDMAREIGARWKLLSDSQKAKWTAKGKAGGAGSKRRRSSSSASE